MTLVGAALLCAGCPVVGDVSSPEWTAYGYVKADFALNSNGASLPASGDYVVAVEDTSPEPDGTFTMSARDSRFGAKLDMGAVTGRVEVDFHGDDLTGIAGDVLFRHAYVALDLGNDMRLLVGQTDDVFAPLNPYTLNYTVGWQAGNVGHRSPQFRWEWTPEMGPVNVQAAFSDPQDTQIGMPDIQARVGFKLGENVDLGASIVTGKTEVSGALPADAEEDIFGLAVDVTAKLGMDGKLAIKGEWHTGQNLGPTAFGTAGYMGNIGMAVPDNAEIGCDGLWVAAEIKPTETLTVNAGITIASNDDGDIADGEPENNTSLFGNAIFHLNENTDVGIEISKWETEYKGSTTEFDNLRIQGSVIVRF
jgi:hypothetical protein